MAPCLTALSLTRTLALTLSLTLTLTLARPAHGLAYYTHYAMGVQPVFDAFRAATGAHPLHPAPSHPALAPAPAPAPAPTPTPTPNAHPGQARTRS